MEGQPVKTMYLCTHADRHEGADPHHTQEGIKRLNGIKFPAAPDIRYIVRGTGRRHKEVELAIRNKGIPDDSVTVVSPFVGSADAINKDCTITLANGERVRAEEYVGLIGTVGFDPRQFLAGLPPKTLVCTGGEFLIALGLDGINERGALYQLDAYDPDKAVRIG